jgi:hypothetical protein
MEPTPRVLMATLVPVAQVIGAASLEAPRLSLSTIIWCEWRNERQLSVVDIRAGSGLLATQREGMGLNDVLGGPELIQQNFGRY